jgi:hypothetical protein
MTETNGTALEAPKARKATTPKAPAKAAAKKAADNAATPKLKWQFPDGFAERSKTGQCAPFAGGMLEMKPVDGKWRATYTKAGKTQTLAENCGAGKAYDSCTAFVRNGGAA